MTNRKSFSPILFTAALALIANFPVSSEAETIVSPAPVAPAPAASTAKPPAVAHTINYTVVAGDSLTSIAKKFNTTRKKLKALNNITAAKVTPGQVLLVPSTKNAKSPAATAAAKAKSRHDYAMAQPVQDFDVPASTFASCPVPIANPDEDTDATPPPISTGKAAPIAKLVSPADLDAQARQDRETPDVTFITPTTPVPAPAPAVKKTTVVAQNKSTKPLPTPVANMPAPSGLAHTNPVIAPFDPPTPRLTARGINPMPSANSSATTASNDWGNRFLQTARTLGNQGIEYDDDWRPPGEAHSWVMDCSNTSRYIYKVTTGLQLPRTASDQYYYLHLQGKAWDVPLNSGGLADTVYLKQRLKPGDLLFWENTYRPERQPPITHVMVFLGTNAQGQWIMAGSQSSRGGEHNRRNGGPDVYIFRPSQPCGGYTTWMGLVRHQGRFCAFGRPLEADPTKLSVATDN